MTALESLLLVLGVPVAGWLLLAYLLSKPKRRPHGRRPPG